MFLKIQNLLENLNTVGTEEKQIIDEIINVINDNSDNEFIPIELKQKIDLVLLDGIKEDEIEANLKELEDIIEDSKFITESKNIAIHELKDKAIQKIEELNELIFEFHFICTNVLSKDKILSIQESLKPENIDKQKGKEISIIFKYELVSLFSESEFVNGNTTIFDYMVKNKNMTKLRKKFNTLINILNSLYF